MSHEEHPAPGLSGTETEGDVSPDAWAGGDHAFLYAEPDARSLKRGRKASGEELTWPAHRRRILAAIVSEAAESGSVEMSVAAIATRARISRRTFYAHFPSKEEAFLSTFDCCTVATRQAVEASGGAVGAARLSSCVSAYLDAMTGSRAFAIVVTAEIHRVGFTSQHHQQRFHEWWGEVLQAEVAQARAEDEHLRLRTHELKASDRDVVVAAMDDLVRKWLQHRDRDRLVEEAIKLLMAVVSNEVAALVRRCEAAASDIALPSRATPTYEEELQQWVPARTEL